MFLDLANRVDDAGDGAAREGTLQLRYEVARFVRPPGEDSAEIVKKSSGTNDRSAK